MIQRINLMIIGQGEMKKRYIIICLFIIQFELIITAQSAETYLELLRSDINLTKKTMVAENMNLNEIDSEKFWVIYRDYEYEWEKLMDERFGIIKEYAANFDGLSEETADKMINAWFDIDHRMINLKMGYYKRFSDKIGKRQAGKYMQIITRIHKLIDIQLAMDIPLFRINSSDNSESQID